MERERIEKDWLDYLTQNPKEVIPMLAVLLSVMGIERIEDESSD